MVYHNWVDVWYLIISNLWPMLWEKAAMKKTEVSGVCQLGSPGDCPWGNVEATMMEF